MAIQPRFSPTKGCRGKQSSARCLRCHGEAHEQSRFAESAHASSDVGCLDCHSPHHAKEKQHLIDHQGVLFDDLYVNSSRWGGDPNNALRFRADKTRWYNLQGSFRRDQNFSDYTLLANPLNPPTSSPSIPALNSPHEFVTTRRMSDIDLTLLPQSRISFRLGYSHNNMNGPSFSGVHEGTDGFLLQPWNTTMNSYRLGVDWRILPRTVLSYDQFLNYYRGDTDPQLATFAPALLPGGRPVELGLPIDTANRTP